MAREREESRKLLGGAWHDRRGFTLIEMLIVITLIAIVTAIVAMNSNFVKGDQLKAATRQLYADLQKVKQNAIMFTTPSVNSRGFGMRFVSNGAYTTFEFTDANDNYAYDGAGEESGGQQMTLPSSVTVTLNNAGDPTGDVTIFDKRGILRATNWSTASSKTFVLRLAGASQARCVQIDGVTIREGKWDGVSCN